MGALKYHPGMVLRDDAAAAINAMEDKYGPIIINRAGVSEAVQQGLIDRWDVGGPANRPPFLFEPKRPARKSEHVQQIAVDVYNYTSDRPKLEEFGYRWYGKTDPVHYTFTGWNPPATTPPTATPTAKVIEMSTEIIVTAKDNSGRPLPDSKRRAAFVNTDSGFASVLTWMTLADADLWAKQVKMPAGAIRFSDSAFDSFIGDLK